MRLETWRENKENKNCQYIAEYLPACSDCIKTGKDLTRAASARGVCWSTSGGSPNNSRLSETSWCCCPHWVQATQKGGAFALRQKLSGKEARNRRDYRGNSLKKERSKMSCKNILLWLFLGVWHNIGESNKRLRAYCTIMLSETRPLVPGRPWETCLAKGPELSWLIFLMNGGTCSNTPKQISIRCFWETLIFHKD